ncbi:MAG: PorV/PorQ family protein [Elusimicrobiales bacterium]|nr:PorV/PorQ family protein [Elusimicrobiales bacterium]
MKNYTRLALLAVIPVLCAPVYAATTGSAFLKIAPGAREQGMANAVTAAGGSLQSLYANPAGMATVEDTEAAVSHVELAQENKLENITFGHAAFGGRLAYGLTYVHYDDLDGRDLTGAQTGNFTAYDAALQLAYARSFGKLAVGGALKAVRNKIETECGDGSGFDAGAIYSFDKFKLGAAIVNAGKSGKVGSLDENLPATAAIGAATTIKTVTVSADYKRNLPENRTTLAAGAEAKLIPLFTIRAGYSRDITNKDTVPSDNMLGLSAGFGLALGKLNLDYAYTSQGELGNNHRFTLGAKF